MEPSTKTQDRRLMRLNRLGYLLDNSIRLPGGFRIGYDALIGLIPGVGDAAGLALSGWVILQGALLGASVPVLARMVINAAIEAVVGSVPVLGDVFDAGWKANARNVRLLHEHFGIPVPRRKRSWLRIVILAAVVIALLILAGWGIVVMGRWLDAMIRG